MRDVSRNGARRMERASQLDLHSRADSAGQECSSGMRPSSFQPAWLLVSL